MNGQLCVVERPQKRLECDCGTSFSITSNLFSHCRKRRFRCFPKSAADSGLKGVNCAYCTYVAFNRNILLKHLERTHNIKAVEVQRVFENFEAVSHYIEELRKKQSEFQVAAIRRDCVTKKICQIRYNCARSGRYAVKCEQRFRRSKKGLTKKSGFLCTANLIATKVEDRELVLVTGCLTHHGHDTNPSLMRLDKSLEEAVTQFARQGLSNSEILEKVRQLNVSVKASLLRDYDVRNIIARQCAAGKLDIEQMNARPRLRQKRKTSKSATSTKNKEDVDYVGKHVVFVDDSAVPVPAENVVADGVVVEDTLQIVEEEGNTVNTTLGFVEFSSLVEEDMGQFTISETVVESNDVVSQMEQLPLVAFEEHTVLPEEIILEKREDSSVVGITEQTNDTGEVLLQSEIEYVTVGPDEGEAILEQSKVSESNVEHQTESSEPLRLQKQLDELFKLRKLTDRLIFIARNPERCPFTDYNEVLAQCKKTCTTLQPIIPEGAVISDKSAFATSTPVVLPNIVTLTENKESSANSTAKSDFIVHSSEPKLVPIRHRVIVSSSDAGANDDKQNTATVTSPEYESRFVAQHSNVGRKLARIMKARVVSDSTQNKKFRMTPVLSAQCEKTESIPPPQQRVQPNILTARKRKANLAAEVKETVVEFFICDAK